MTIEVGRVGGLPRLAPDLNIIADRATAASGASLFRQTGDIDGTSGLTVGLSLTGKFELSSLMIKDNVAENYTLKLTVDGVVIWNASNTLPSNTNLIGIVGRIGVGSADPFVCDQSVLLEVESTTDTAFKFGYVVRPIL